MLRDRLALTEEGARSLRKGALVCALANLVLMFPVGVFYLVTGEFLAHWEDGAVPLPTLGSYLVLIAVVLAAVSSAAACSSAEVSLPPQAARAKHRVRESKSNANFFMGKTSFHLFVNSVLGCAMGIGYPLSTKNGTLWHESHQKRPESTVLTETAAG